MLDIDASSIGFFAQQKISDEETTEHKKETYTQIAIFQKVFFGKIIRFVSSEISKAHHGMVYKHRKKGEKPQPVKVGEVYFLGLIHSGCNRAAIYYFFSS